MGRTVLAVAAALLGACEPAPYPAPDPLGPRPPAFPSQPPTAGCPIDSSSDWAAWVNAMPGPSARPTLIVTGKVTVPTGGYRFAWRDMRVMESYPVQVAVELVPIEPAGPATLVFVTHEVRGEWPMAPPVGSLTISCGGKTLAAISPVETAQ